VKANPEGLRGKPAAEKPWTTKLWIYDRRTNKHLTLKENPLKRSDLDDFVSCYFGGKHGSQSRGYSVRQISHGLTQILKLDRFPRSLASDVKREYFADGFFRSTRMRPIGPVICFGQMRASHVAI
jgi:hypothetical protein